MLWFSFQKKDNACETLVKDDAFITRANQAGYAGVKETPTAALCCGTFRGRKSLAMLYRNERSFA